MDFITNPMLNVLLLVYDLLGNNFGIAIIVFTVLIRLLTYPLTASSLKSTQKMQEMQNSKKWKDIQKKWKRLRKLNSRFKKKLRMQQQLRANLMELRKTKTRIAPARISMTPTVTVMRKCIVSLLFLVRCFHGAALRRRPPAPV